MNSSRCLPEPAPLAAADLRAQWPDVRAEWLRRAQEWRYGMVPDPRGRTRVQLLHRAHPPVQPGRAASVLSNWRVAGDDGVTFVLRLLQTLPEPGRPLQPVVISGDGCWLHLDATARDAIASAGLAVAWFDRTEVAPDPPDPHVASGVGAQRPAPGAVARWAGAYRHALDVLAAADGIDASRMALHGHSRGGKSALLAGAVDERVWMTAAHNAGCAGSASDAVSGAGAETLSDLARRFPHWLCPAVTQRLLEVGVAGQRPVDHADFDTWQLAACIAPRRLLIAQSEDDLWANPDGVRHAHGHWQQVYDALGAPGRLSVMWRDGPHPPALSDWQRLAQAVAAAAHEDAAAS